MSSSVGVSDRPIPADLSGAHVVIWGLGRHGGGLAAARWCQQAGAQVAILERDRPSELGEAAWQCAANGWRWHLGQWDHPVCRRADFIVANPAIPPTILARLPADAAPLLSPEAFFFDRHCGPRIAITGTKGKSSTARMLGALLDWPVGGNSHRPLLDVLRRHGAETPVVCELSSFQLHHLNALRPSFQAGIVTHLGIDHLDWHGDAEAYRSSKIRFADWCQRLYVPAALRERFPSARQARVDLIDGHFTTTSGQTIAPRDNLSLAGDHQTSNAMLALAAALDEGLDPTIAGIRLTTVTPLPHRFELVGDCAGLQYIDDSVATAPEATIAALGTTNGPTALILGGRSKGGDYRSLAAACRTRVKDLRLIAIYPCPRELLDNLDEAGLSYRRVADVAEAVTVARQALGPPGGIVLFSPAAATAPPHRDFAERGDAFVAAARQAVDQA